MQDHSWHAQQQARELEWKAVEWPDGTLYEGLASGNSCHRQGVLHFANSDRYEGEFVNNRMQGYGVYVWRDGTIYRGEWQFGMMHGCGVQLRRGPDGEYVAMEGKFFADEYVGPIMSCGAAAAQEAAVEADVAAALGRALQTEAGRRKRQAAGLGRGRARGGKGEAVGEAAGAGGEMGPGAGARGSGAESAGQQQHSHWQVDGTAMSESRRDGGAATVKSDGRGDAHGGVAQGHGAAGRAGPGPGSERTSAAMPPSGLRPGISRSGIQNDLDGFNGRHNSGYQLGAGSGDHGSKERPVWFGLWGLGQGGHAANTGVSGGDASRGTAATQGGVQGQGWGFGPGQSQPGLSPPLGSMGPWRVACEAMVSSLLPSPRQHKARTPVACQLRWPWQPQQPTAGP